MISILIITKGTHSVNIAHRVIVLLPAHHLVMVYIEPSFV